MYLKFDYNLIGVKGWSKGDETCRKIDFIRISREANSLPAGSGAGSNPGIKLRFNRFGVEVICSEWITKVVLVPVVVTGYTCT